MGARRSGRRSRKTVKDLRVHAMGRFNLRFGEKLSVEEYNDLIFLIQKNEAVFHMRESNIKTHWKMSIKGKDVIAVYDRLRKGISTFLCPEGQYIIS